VTGQEERLEALVTALPLEHECVRGDARALQVLVDEGKRLLEVWMSANRKTLRSSHSANL
jgi:hypothetical protein